MTAQQGIGDDQGDKAHDGALGLQGMMNNTIRIDRLKLLFIAAKVVTDSTVAKLDNQSIMPERRSWEEDNSWPKRFDLQAT
jgi:hypothetical protein